MDADISNKRKIAGYHELLADYGNHSDWDMQTLVLGHTLIQGRGLWDKNGNSIKWNPKILFLKLIRFAFFYIFLFIFISAPVLVIFKCNACV
jgi:hypothetical protein